MTVDNGQTGQLPENGDVQNFLKLLMENSPEKGKDFSLVLWQLEGMGRQLDAALRELHEVRSQLDAMQENPGKQSIARAVNAVEGRLHTMQERMAGIWERIVNGAKEAVEGFKRIGIKALDKAVLALGIKPALNLIHKDLGESITDVKKSIEKIETVGRELRSVGGHLKNVGRAVTGHEQQKVDGGMEGCFQAAVLSPLRMEKVVLTKLNNLALAAIGNVERLEQAAGREKRKSIPEAGKGGSEELENDSGTKPLPEKQPEKEKAKPSLIKDLQEGKAQAAARPVPPHDQTRKVQEAAL